MPCVEFWAIAKRPPNKSTVVNTIRFMSFQFLLRKYSKKFNYTNKTTIILYKIINFTL